MRRLLAVICWLTEHDVEAVRGGHHCRRCGDFFTWKEWDQEVRYRAYLRTTWFGCDKAAWIALGEPEEQGR